MVSQLNLSSWVWWKLSRDWENLWDSSQWFRWWEDICCSNSLWGFSSSWLEYTGKCQVFLLGLLKRALCFFNILFCLIIMEEQYVWLFLSSEVTSFSFWSICYKYILVYVACRNTLFFSLQNCFPLQFLQTILEQTAIWLVMHHFWMSFLWEYRVWIAFRFTPYMAW